MGSDGLSRDRLLETAQELGISPDDLAQAEQEMLAIRDQENEKKEFLARRTKKLQNEISSYFGTCGFLFVVNFLTAGADRWHWQGYWVWWVVAFWGLRIPGYLFDLSRMRNRFPEEEFRTWRDKRAQQRFDRGGNVTLSPEENEAVRDGDRILAIRLLRERTGMKLKEAKEVVDQHANAS